MLRGCIVDFPLQVPRRLLQYLEQIQLKAIHLVIPCVRPLLERDSTLDLKHAIIENESVLTMRFFLSLGRLAGSLLLQTEALERKRKKNYASSKKLLTSTKE